MPASMQRQPCGRRHRFIYAAAFGERWVGREGARVVSETNAGSERAIEPFISIRGRSGNKTLNSSHKSISTTESHRGAV